MATSAGTTSARTCAVTTVVMTRAMTIDDEEIKNQ